MSIRSALYKHLSTHAEITPIFGTRIYPQFAPHSAILPRLTYRGVDQEPTRSFAGHAGLTNRTYRLTAWDDDDLGADAGAEVLRDVLDNFSGTLGSAPDSITVQRIYVRGAPDELIAPDDASDVPKFGVSLIVDIWAAEAAPTG